MLVDKDAIFQFIPQRPPIVMVDTLVEHTAEYSISQFEIKTDNIFVQNGAFQTSGMLENIAQTAALRAGYGFMERLQTTDEKPENMKPPIGFIGEVKNLTIHFLPKVGEELTTKVTLIHQVFNSSIITGSVLVNGETAAHCEMKIFVKG